MVEDLVAAGIVAVFLMFFSAVGIITAKVIYNRNHPPLTMQDKIEALEKGLEMNQ